MYKRRYHKNRIIFLSIFAFFFAATFAFLAIKNQDKTEAASTANFRAGNIMSDSVMRDYNSMNVAQIQSFLSSKNACNRTASTSSLGAVRDNGAINQTILGVTYNHSYTFNTSNGLKDFYYHIKDGKVVCLANEKINGKSAAQIIYEAAQKYQVSPKVLIVLLEKEQSFVTDTFPNHIQYQGATGYGYPDNGEPDPRFFGFESQVHRAAALFHEVLTGGWTNYPVGNNYIQYHPNPGCGGSKVYIENRATSALYRYTPYQPNASALAAGYGAASDGCGAYGNRNFFLLYSDWFGNPHAVPKSAAATNNTKAEVGTSVNYQSHLQDIGWESGWKQDGKTSGTTGQSRRLEAVNIKLTELKDAHIYYQSHLQNIGWESGWKQDGKTSGTTGQSRRLEAIKIKLDDTSAKTYDIYYRSHVQDYGWLAWAKNGEPSGSEGLSKRLEAVEVVVVKKGAAAPTVINQNSSKAFIK